MSFVDLSKGIRGADRDKTPIHDVESKQRNEPRSKPCWPRPLRDEITPPNGARYGELVDPQFVYKDQRIDHGQAEGEAGLCLPDQGDVAVRVAQATSRFIARPHPL